MIDQLVNHSLRSKNFAIADALTEGTPAAISSGCGGGSNFDSDLLWDGRRPDEEEDEYRRRCLKTAIIVVMRSSKSRGRNR